MTRFVHIRKPEWDGSPRGQLTIAFRGLGESGFEYAVAYCSPKEQFSKVIGRNLAQERLETSPFTVTSGVMGKGFGRCIVAALCDIIPRGDHPAWARDVVLEEISERMCS